MIRGIRNGTLLRPLILLLALVLCAAPLHAADSPPETQGIWTAIKFAMCALGLGLATGPGVVIAALGCILLFHTDTL